MKYAITLLLIAAAIAPTAMAQDRPSIQVGTYLQEVAHKHADGLPSADVTDIAINGAGTVYAATAAGTVRWDGAQWTSVALPEGAADLFTLDGTAYARQGAAIFVLGDTATPATLEGHLAAIAQLEDTAAFVSANPGEWDLRQWAVSPDGLLAAATSVGVFTKPAGEAWMQHVFEDGLGRRWAVKDVRGIVIAADGAHWVATPAGVIEKRGDTTNFYTGEDGLPYADFTCAAAGPDGSVWFGTHLGAVRYKDGAWAYRQGPRWLPSDDIRAIAVAADGSTWFATAKGVGQIELKPMTLEEKSAFYVEQLERFIKRTPFGYTSEVGVATPGDTSEIIYSDSDNDGLWTAMYGASEAYQYAVTKDAATKDRAVRAFEALRHLQTVTQGGEHSPPKGFVARTILPTDGPDPNVGRLEADRQTKASGDSLWKLYEPRWPKSADGQWYWKSDTSSDELDGHYYFYPLYYDLVAETEEEKARVVEVIRDLTDHIMTHGFYMIDHDGTPTRWAVYGPDSLNNDPNWFGERGLKSLSILSYLYATQHMTGDPKYGAAAKGLIDNHGYLANLMNPKMQLGVGSGNQSDDEMAFMCFYNLMKYCDDPVVLENARYSFRRYWLLIQPERNPLFHFMYAVYGLGQTTTNPWGTWSIEPEGDWLEDSVDTLKGFPLDRFSWPHKNSHRLDVRELRRQEGSEPYEPWHGGRGYLVDGKVLPIENRHFNHWNTDPWRLDYGGDGRTLASGAVYLLPYWMGRYYGFIE